MIYITEKFLMSEDACLSGIVLFLKLIAPRKKVLLTDKLIRRILSKNLCADCDKETQLLYWLCCNDEWMAGHYDYVENRIICANCGKSRLVYSCKVSKNP